MKLDNVQSYTEEILAGINWGIVEKKRYCTAILIYTAIDTLSSLTRPESQADTNGGVFKAWVEKYLLNEMETELTAEDIWGARCGVLHTNQPDSRKSREGKARTLQYIQADKDILDFAQTEMDPEKKEIILIDLGGIAESFAKAVLLFFYDVNTDSELRKRVEHHAQNTFLNSSIKSN